MSGTNFDRKQLADQLFALATRKMRSIYERDINSIASEYSEDPQVEFVERGDGRLGVKFSVSNAELYTKIEQYIAEQPLKLCIHTDERQVSGK